MAFAQKNGFPGKIYVPEDNSSTGRKHDCQDCFACQNCSDERCTLCFRDKREIPAKTGD